MLLFNEKNEQLNVSDVVAQLQDSGDTSTPSVDEVETALGNYYNQALQLQAAKFKVNVAMSPAAAMPESLSFLPGIGGKILAEIRKFICGFLGAGSTESEIIQAVLSALASIIPGGVFIKALAGMVVKYILSIGVNGFCNIAAA